MLQRRISTTATLRSRTTSTIATHSPSIAGYRIHTFSNSSAGKRHFSMGSGQSSHDESHIDQVNQWNKENKVMVYSKTYCPYCNEIKRLFSSKYGDVWSSRGKVLELDTMGEEGQAIQSALKQITGQRTVPSVWINGKHIGGCDDTLQMDGSGELGKLIKQD